MAIQCDVYKSSTKLNFYLYVSADTGLESVPDDLLAQFGELEIALSFELSEERGLAKEDPAVVFANIRSQGYHLQLPPAEYRFHG
jgi:uncharacterized protein YcgL (UPF0745 family)